MSEISKVTFFENHIEITKHLGRFKKYKLFENTDKLIEIVYIIKDLYLLSHSANLSCTSSVKNGYSTMSIIPGVG